MWSTFNHKSKIFTQQDLNIYKEIEQSISDNESTKQDVLLSTTNLYFKTPKTTHQTDSSSVTHQSQQKYIIKETHESNLCSL